jgi:DnaK suppressor protein
MPPLNRREIIELARSIEERREALQEEIRGEIGDLVADLARADTLRDAGELEQLDAARKRIADGSYGTCADCGADIGIERLRAEPGAARCVECQARHEKTYRT